MPVELQAVVSLTLVEAWTAPDNIAGTTPIFKGLKNGEVLCEIEISAPSKQGPGSECGSGHSGKLMRMRIKSGRALKWKLKFEHFCDRQHRHRENFAFCFLWNGKYLRGDFADQRRTRGPKDQRLA
ncbi:hypothetical protein C8J57DRAFT_1240151 [Mycena rebaudengoi]|nr:hypothetical protein C8J57DRAFT_1240151 [Mycena rebaudengoi]